MRGAEQDRREKDEKVRRAKPARRSLAFNSPRPQLLKGSTKESMSSKPKPSDGDFVAATGGSVADAFFGASPVVASVLGIRSGATPHGRIHSNPTPSALLRKADISTLLGIGHFYFALTGGGRAESTETGYSPQAQVGLDEEVFFAVGPFTPPGGQDFQCT